MFTGYEQRNLTQVTSGETEGFRKGQWEHIFPEQLHSDVNVNVNMNWCTFLGVWMFLYVLIKDTKPAWFLVIHVLSLIPWILPPLDFFGDSSLCVVVPPPRCPLFLFLDSFLLLPDLPAATAS